MNALEVRVEGIGCWSPQWGDWATAAALLRGGRVAAGSLARPPATSLAPAERRRASPLILLACEVAAQACAAAARAPAELPCVFSSAHGDLATADSICATLALNPRELSPTRFHNSVHNAAIGYWTVAGACRAPSTAISAAAGSLAAGLLEASLQSLADARPVLLIACEAAADGPLAVTLGADATLGLALVLNARSDAQDGPRLTMQRAPNASMPQVEPAPALLAALAAGRPAELALPADGGAALRLTIAP